MGKEWFAGTSRCKGNIMSGLWNSVKHVKDHDSEIKETIIRLSHSDIDYKDLVDVVMAEMIR